MNITAYGARAGDDPSVSLQIAPPDFAVPGVPTVFAKRGFSNAAVNHPRREV